MKIKALVFSGITLALSCAPFSFGQAASSDAAKPKVVITDDNLSEQLRAKPADDQSGDAAQPATPTPTAMSAEEMAGLENSISVKEAKLTDVQDHMIAMAAKLEQETDDEQKSRDQDYLKASQASVEKLTGQIADLKKKLEDAKANAGTPAATDDQTAAQPAGTSDTSK